MPNDVIIETSLHGVPLLTIVGEADHSLGPELAEAARRTLSPRGGRILLDLKLCPYLDSGGLNVIVQLVREVGPQGWVGVVHCSRMVLRLLELVGLTTCAGLRVFETLEEAGRAAAAADTELFDEWPERYEEWFSMPIGRLVKETECSLVLEMLSPEEGERILDAGCGTGIFTLDYLAAGAEVVGLDISGPMLAVAARKAAGYPFTAVQGDMVCLPFDDGIFDKAVSVTALEFIEDGKRAVDELFRVTRPGGLVVVGTLNSLGPWAKRRRAKTKQGQRHILEGAFFRSPDELLACSPVKGTARTVVHFQKGDQPEEAVGTERRGQAEGVDTGAFVAARWVKPF